MSSRSKIFFIVLSFCSLFFTIPATAATPTPPPRPANYVVDLADIIDPTAEQALNSYLRELDKKTSAQVVVLTIKSLDGESIEGFSIDMAEKWRLGQKGKDNGVLFTISRGDRRYRMEVGYGLEGLLPDSLVGSIGRQYLVPYFRKGKYSQGITYATLAIIGRIADDAKVTITGMQRVSSRRGQTLKKPSLGSAIFAILVLLIMGYFFIRNPRAFMMFIFFMMMSRGGRGGWRGGGGFGGGGGGFGGGGGGFGGGGASGGW